MDFDSMLDDQGAMDKVMAAKKDAMMKDGQKMELSPALKAKADMHIEALEQIAAQAGCSVEDLMKDEDAGEDESMEMDVSNADDDSEMDDVAPMHSEDDAKGKKKMLVIAALMAKKKKQA